MQWWKKQESPCFSCGECQGWSYDKMDEEEIKILNKLYDEKHIVYSPEKIIVTRKFYNYIQDILATGYVEEFIRNE